MADNLAVPAEGSTVAFDDINGVMFGRSKITLGADGVNDGDVSAANPMPVTGPLTDAQIRATPVAVAGRKVEVTAGELTRPANTTAYTAGDVVSNSASATTLLSFPNFARVNAGSGYIVGARLVTDKKSITPRFRVHLYNAGNPTVAADNAAFDSRYADAAKRIGWFDLPAMTTGTDTTNSTESASQDMTLRIPFIAAAGTRDIYAVLEILDAFTPSSGQKFLLTLIGELD